MDSDPLSWSVSRVVEFFRHEAAGLLQDRPNLHLPELDNFTQTLQENGVDGDILLKSVDASALREELGVRSFAARIAVRHCIEKLQALSTIRHSGESDPIPQTPNSMVGLPNAPNSDPGPEPVPVPKPSPGENVRAGELEVQDNRGKKRRKLDLSAAQSTAPASKPKPPAGYMSDSKLPVDDLFYGETAMNGAIGDLMPKGEDIILHPNYNLDEIDADQRPFHAEVFIEFRQQNFGEGDATYVHRQMRHFFANDKARLVRRRGKDAIAVLPYREELVAGKKSVSATVFRLDKNAEDGAIAVRENAAFLDEDVDFIGQEQESNGGEWDFLTAKHRQQPDEGVFPEYGQSVRGDEISSDLDREIEADQADLEAELEEEKKGFIQQENAVQIIDDRIAFVAEKWKEMRIPILEQKKAWTVWKRMKGSKTFRDQLIESSNDRINDFDKRLAKQKEYMLRARWRNEKELREQCEVMKTTIEDRELYRWKISVWMRRQEPHHTVRHGQHYGGSKGQGDTSGHQRIVVHPNDRISVSPAPAQGAQMDEDGEKFHTPEGDNLGDAEHQDDENSFDGGDEMDVDSPIADWVEPSPPLVFGSPSNLPLDAPNDDVDDQASASRSPRNDFPTHDVGSESETLADMATILSQRPKPERAPTPTPKPASSWNNREQPIEISSDSPSTPASKRARKKGVAGKKKKIYSSDPLGDTLADVMMWDMQDLLDNQDRHRLLIKLLFDAGYEKRQEIQRFIQDLLLPKFKDAVRKGVEALQKNITITVAADASETAVYCARLFLAFLFLSPETMQGVPPSKASPQDYLDSGQVDFFSRFLQQTLQKSKLFVEPKPEPTSSVKSKVSRVISLSSDSEDDENEIETPSKKKRKQPLLSEKGQQSQMQALDRQVRFRELQQQSSSQQQLEAMVQNDPSRSNIQINIMKEDDEEDIFVDTRIAKDMKDYQAAGVQFMWRELTATDEHGAAQGCVLAHEQGLGKTVQTIAILIALNEAAQSENPNVYQQLPQSLRPKGIKKRQLRVLILVPASIVANWCAEFSRWAPERLPNVFPIESSDSKEHMQKLQEWYRIGGVLIIGYENFRNKVSFKENNQIHVATEGPHAKFLLKGPEIVVADEAHKLSNEKTRLSLVARQLKTESRLALTGTPMSNDVQEIYGLVSFVAPGFLGDSKWFNARFAKPIKDGNGKDSTSYQQRLAIKRLALLHRKIEPKVDRADITVLKGSLPPKVEFVITLTLTAVQREAYAKYVEHLVGEGKTEDAAQTTLFGYLSVLTLLTNHPLAFKRKMLSPGKAKRRQSRDQTPAESDTGSGMAPQENVNENDKDDDDAEGQSVRTSGFSEEAIKRITSGIEDDISAQLSTKMFVLMEIVRHSKSIGDKVLVFSHSIPSLDYVGELFKACRINYVRIDGSVGTKHREPILKDMRSGKRDVMLMSTKAGGVGLNIQVANRVIILDSSFNPTHERQAISRSYRLGQEKPVFVYRFSVGGTFEQMLYNKQMLKTGLTNRVVDKKNTKRIANIKTEHYIREPFDVEQADLEEHLGKDSILDSFVEAQREEAKDSGREGIMIRNLETMETLQQEVLDAPLTEEERREVEEEFQQEGRVMGRKSAAGLSGSKLPSSTAPAKSRRPQPGGSGVRPNGYQSSGAQPDGLNGLPGSTQPGQPGHAHPASRIVKLPHTPRSTAPPFHGLPIPPPDGR